jgi:hypothetical protein
MAAAETMNRTVESACTPKSRMIAAKLRTTVPTRKIADSRESWPRIGIPFRGWSDIAESYRTVSAP